MGKKSKAPEAPEYQNTTYNTGGLFGASTSDKNGTSYTGNNYMNRLGGMSWQGIENSLNNLNNTDFSKDKNYKVYSDNLQRQMRENFDNNVLSSLADRGLMRSSGLRAATEDFNNTLANQTANLYDSYYNRQQNNLANYQNTLNNLFNYITGVSNLGMQANGLINNFNRGNYQNQLSAYNAANQNNSGLWGSLANAAGSIGGSIAGGPVGGAVGSGISSIFGNLMKN